MSLPGRPHELAMELILGSNFLSCILCVSVFLLGSTIVLLNILKGNSMFRVLPLVWACPSVYCISVCLC